MELHLCGALARDARERSEWGQVFIPLDSSLQVFLNRLCPLTRCIAPFQMVLSQQYNLPWVLVTSTPLEGFPSGSARKESACNTRDPGSIPGLGRSPVRWHGNPLQHAFLENPHGQRSLACGRKELDRTTALLLRLAPELITISSHIFPSHISIYNPFIEFF